MDRQSIPKEKTTNNELANKVSLNRQNENSSDVKYSETINSKNNSISNRNGIGLFNHDFSTVPVGIQTKLKIGEANDQYEQEADRVAEQVMRMPKPGTNSLNYKSTANNSIQRKCSSCEEEELLQRKTSRGHNSEINPGLSLKINSLSGGGRPMSASERGFFEPRFGSDFSNVRVHENSQANNMARSIDARAFTLGNNIVLGAGEYSSGSNAGKKLFAHELTHVVQQGGNKNVIQKLDGDPTRVEITYADSGVLETRSILRVCDNGIIHFDPHGSAHISNFSNIRHDDGELTTITPESLRVLYAAIGMQPISCPVERGDTCTCDPSTHEAYNSSVISFIRSLKSMIQAQAIRKGVPPTAIAGAIADEYRTREFPRSILDFTQDHVLDSLSEWQIDIDRFFDFDSKLLNAMENDVGPANINVRTATQMVEEEGLVVPNSPQSNVVVSEIIDFLLTNAGTVETTAVVIRRAKNRFDPYLWAYSPVSYDSILVEYFKQGDSYYRRSLTAITANPDHEICTGDGGCRVIYNYSRLSQAIV